MLCGIGVGTEVGEESGVGNVPGDGFGCGTSDSLEDVEEDGMAGRRCDCPLYHL